MIKVTDIMGNIYPIKLWTFSAGEVGVRLLSKIPEKVIVKWTHDYSAIMQMQVLMLGNAINNAGSSAELVTPYLPYSRQDRVCAKGEASAKSEFLHLLNISYTKIHTEDCHSNAYNKGYNDVKLDVDAVLDDFYPEATVVVFPDKGAKEKYKTKRPSVHGIKTRDTNTGNITNYELSNELSNDDIIVVIDDICDGGKTFVELGKLLPKDAEKYLYVTHGIFSKGFKELNNYYSTIYCKNRIQSHV